jgi:tetratricopeptide (TPR) repeat protein
MDRTPPVKVDPKHAAELQGRIEKALKHEELCTAVELLAALVTREDCSGRTWFDYGDSLLAVGRLIEAEKALSMARNLAPPKQQFNVDARLGMVASRMGSSVAERCFALAVQSSECPGWVCILRAVNFIKLESIDLSRECLIIAKERGTIDLDEVLVNEALIERHASNYVLAAEYAEAALQIDPESIPAREILASIAGAADAQRYVRSLFVKH